MSLFDYPLYHSRDARNRWDDRKSHAYLSPFRWQIYHNSLNYHVSVF